MMNTNNKNKVWFREGQVVTAKVAYVKAATVYFDMRGVGAAVARRLRDQKRRNRRILAERRRGGDFCYAKCA